MKSPPRMYVATSAGLVPSSPASPADATSPMQLPDSLITFWDELFRAVRTRLRQTVVASSRGPADGTGVEEDAAAAQRLRDDVLDCVAALDQLHAALTHEAARSRRIEQALSRAHAELDRVRVELAGSQAVLPRPRSVGPQEGTAAAARPTLFRVPAAGTPEAAAAPPVLPGPCLHGGYPMAHGGTLR